MAVAWLCVLLVGLSIRGHVAGNNDTHDNTMTQGRAIPSASVPGMDPALGLLLVPGLDFANHDDNVRLQFAAGLRGGLALVCDRSYSRGEEVTTTYGPKSNAQMLMSMGFSREQVEHPFNSADILLTLRDDDDMRPCKTAALLRAGLAPSMRFRVPSWPSLLRRGLLLRAPPPPQRTQPAPREGAAVSGVGMAGEEELMASWAPVCLSLFLPLSLSLSRARRQQLPERGAGAAQARTRGARGPTTRRRRSYG